MKILFAAALAALACAACTTTVPSPVTADYRSAYTIERFEIGLASDQVLPDRYDRSVNDYLASDLAGPEGDEFRAFAEARGGLTETNSGELMLEFLIADELERRLGLYYTGDRPAAFELEIVSTIWPNTATMLLVGEVIGGSYEFELRDAADGTVLARSVERLSPFVERSAGAGGGMLGIALRGAGDRHLVDLERVATAIVEEAVDILGGSPINKINTDRIAVYPIPSLATDSAAGAGDPGEPVSD